MILYHFIIIVSTLILIRVCDEINPKSSLVFVIDKTLSMGPVIEEVKNGVNAIFDTVTSSPESPIENYVLVLFGDPNVSDALVTKDREKFKNTLRTITLEDGGLCPEKAMTGIETALNASLRGSYVYVFTDASAVDFNKIDQVKRIAQEKECQIVFVLTSICAERTMLSEDSIVYLQLAEATSGQVFHMYNPEVNKILEYVKHSITSRRITLYSKKYASGEHALDIMSDLRTKDLTLAISPVDKTDVAGITVTITGPEGETIDEGTQKIGQILIFKVSESTPGTYLAEFSCKVPSYVVVTARSDVRFRHGFSTNVVSSLDDTVFSPIRDTNNYLSIKLFGEDVRLTTVKLLDPSYHKLLELPLKLEDDREKLYITELFDPPSSKFRIVVQGVDTKSNTNITRFGSLVLETEKFKDRTPTVNIKGNRKVAYNGKLQLNCTVEGYPAPEIVWKDLATGIKQVSIVNRAPPYYHYSLLELNNLNNSKSYECTAENKLGRENKQILVEVEPEPYMKVIQQPESQELDYGAKAVLHCEVKSYPPAKLSWIFDKWKDALVKRGDIIFSPDNSTLTVKHLKPRTGGRYGCKIEYHDTSHILPYATITLSAKKPVFEKPLWLEMFFKKGENINLTCSLLEGKPKPKIIWYSKLALDTSAKYKKLKEDSKQTSVFSIVHADRLNAGVYKCRAYNAIGREERTISLSIESEPTVVLNTTEKILVEKDTRVNIKCTVQGEPTPVVEWLKDGTLLEINAAIEIKVYRDHSSISIKSNLRHTGIYTCKAKNRLGRASGSVHVTVYSLNVTEPLNTKFVRRVKQNINLPCRNYITGDPEPTLEWIFFSFNNTISPKTLTSEKTSSDRTINLTNGNLTITNIQENHRGNYTCCVRSNTGNPVNITFEVDVQFPPVRNSTRVHLTESVDGDRVMRILCNVTGNPEPTITWQKDGLSLTNGDKYIFEEKWLIIPNVDDTINGNYKCKATNKIFGHSYLVRRSIRVTINMYPPPKSIKNTTTMFVAAGNKKLIKCYLSYTRLDVVNWYKDKRKIHRGELELHNASLSDSGVYTCRVNRIDSLEIESANTSVIVGFKPIFVTNPPPNKIELYSGEEVFLDCLVYTEANLTITWWHNGKTITFSGFLYTFKMDTGSVGDFKCEVTNKFGLTSRSYDLVLKEFTECILQIDEDAENQPLILTQYGTWPEFKTTGGLTTIPKLQIVVFSCPTHFTRFDETNLQATCYGETHFFIRDKVHNYTDIKCNADVRPSFITPKRGGKNIQCQGEKTTTGKIVFGEDPITTDAIEYCLDKDYNPIYAKHIMRYPANYIPKNTTMWDNTALDSYKCENQRRKFSRFLFDKTKCCFARRHLVNPRDMFPGPQQRATYNRLNIVPHWSTCHSENWDEVEQRVRTLAESINDKLIIYTGIARKLSLYDTIHGSNTVLTLQKQHIATHLWKIVQYPAENSSIVILQLNIPDIKLSEVNRFIQCTDICNSLPWMNGTNWSSVEKGYTYCCKLENFLKKFRFTDIPVEPYFNLLRG